MGYNPSPEWLIYLEIKRSDAMGKMVVVVVVVVVELVVLNNNNYCWPSNLCLRLGLRLGLCCCDPVLPI